MAAAAAPSSSSSTSLWLFGYASLIWKPGNELRFTSRSTGFVRGYRRKFCQASRDHRGTDEAPGRVCTLVEADNSVVYGAVYEIPGQTKEDVLQYLDHREKGGYVRHWVTCHLVGDDGKPAGQLQDVLLYMGSPDDQDFLGATAEDDDAIARVIAKSVGPSGKNVDYLFGLAEALRGIPGAEDDHVTALEKAVKNILAEEEEVVK